MTINILDRLNRARAVQRAEYLEQEKVKRGTLRAGSSGIMAENGDIAGNCHRKSLLRNVGIEIDPPTAEKLIMFELGYASEDITADLLKLSLEPDEVMLREEEIPLEWQTRNGVRVTGRPDLVICSTEQRPNVGCVKSPGTLTVVDKGIVYTATEPAQYDVWPVLGLELKSVHSVWTAREVLFNRTPKLGNLAQACHYMWRLGVPYKLIYKGYSALGQGMSWAPHMARMFPAQGQPGSEYMKYNEEKGVPLEVMQFEIAYDLALDEKGRLKYAVEGTDEWKSTIVSTGDIERYYEYVSTMEKSGDLGPRPMTLDPHGGKLNYKDCAYCPMQEVCDKYEAKGFEAWMAAVHRQMEKPK